MSCDLLYRKLAFVGYENTDLKGKKFAFSIVLVNDLKVFHFLVLDKIEMCFVAMCYRTSYSLLILTITPQLAQLLEVGKNKNYNFQLI